MMTQDQQEKLILALMATAEVMGNEIKPNVAVVMVDDLSVYALSDVLQALTRVRRECSGKLTLKMILDILVPTSCWLSANEAWAVALPAIDEAATVVWTPEIAKAFEVARPILEGGDKIGARVAFIPAYDRLIDHAKRENRTPSYEVSVGWDANMREVAMRQAVTAGLLPAPKEDETKALPAPDKPKMYDEHVTHYRRREVGLRFKQLADQIRANGDKQFHDRAEHQAQIVVEHEKCKAEAIKQLQERTEHGIPSNA